MHKKKVETCQECGAPILGRECTMCNPEVNEWETDENILYTGPIHMNHTDDTYERDFLSGPGAMVDDEPEEETGQISEEDLALLMEEADGIDPIPENELDQNGI